MDLCVACDLVKMKSSDRFESPKLPRLIPRHGLSAESPRPHRGRRARTLTPFSRGTSPFLNATLASSEAPKFDQRQVWPPALTPKPDVYHMLFWPQALIPSGTRVVLHKCLSAVKDQRKRKGNICLAFLGSCREDVSPGSTPEVIALILSGELFNSWDHLVHSKTLISWASLAAPLPLKGSSGLFSRKSLLISSCLLTQCDV